MSGSRNVLVRDQFEELIQHFPGLELSKDELDHWVVTGDLTFRRSFEDIKLEDSFLIQIVLSHSYPEVPPEAFEVGGRIPRKDDYHVNKSGDMCLAAPIEVRKKFFAKPSLLHFVNELVVPFLYAFSFQKSFGKRPWGELSHGGKGVLEHYQEVFNAEDFLGVLRLLKLLADDNYRGHLSCPCGSGDILRRCHGESLLELMQIQSSEFFLKDIEAVLNSLNKEEIKW